ncbi:hypothetical protein L484_024158 [Morus notabilis]|uniref:Uncharacterized protein n=1 Tax=Morus notabilis TaxID=981085 RepID=W9RMA4_9ROSA|nr:hypothetical protein L484_024158 [Morus notabilis]
MDCAIDWPTQGPSLLIMSLDRSAHYRFRWIYTVRASMLSSQDCNTNMNDKENITCAEKKPERTIKVRNGLAKNDGLVNSNEVKQDTSTTNSNVPEVSKGVKKHY